MSDRLFIIGPGRMGIALGSALLEARAVEAITFQGRALEPPPHPVFEAEGVDYRPGPVPPPPGTTIAILAVPDTVLAQASHDLAAAGPAPSGCAALHLSGALSTEVLTPLHAAGYATGSIHPLQTVADPWAGGDVLVGITYAVSGEPPAVVAARRLASALGGRALEIPPMFRPLYHAAATVASNYLVALMSLAVRMLRDAGIDEGDAVAGLLPLMRGTLANLEHLGVAAALTGPISRGDVDTIRLHLGRLSPDDRVVYCALGRETLRLARGMGLDDARASELESLLSVP